MENKTIMQFFEWYLPADGLHWKRAAAQAKELKQAGINAVWLPPAYKGAGGQKSVGYDVYDLYDLGEFDQKGSVGVKYGTRKEYLAAVSALQKEGIEVLADTVLNQMMGADGTEKVQAVNTAEGNREEMISGSCEIEAWTKFDFPGRKGKYSPHQWSAQNFSGTDYDQATGNKGVYLFDGKKWNRETDSENVNFDYLMGVDLDMENEDTIRALTEWGKWYFQTVGPDGLRLDAVKHIGFRFYREWLKTMRQEVGRDFFAVGEYWSGELQKLLHYLDVVVEGAPENGDSSAPVEDQKAEGTPLSLFDVPLHYAFQTASQGSGDFDMGSIFNGSLVQVRPECAVTFVDNHDTQPGQSLQSFVQPWFKPIAYALILLRKEGTPCVFYGDYYGIPHDNIAPAMYLKQLLAIRASYAYGEQKDYFDDRSIVGFTRSGDSEHEHSGLALLVTDRDAGSKYMELDPSKAGQRFYDALGHFDDPVVLDEKGGAEFAVTGGSLAVWVDEEAYRKVRMI